MPDETLRPRRAKPEELRSLPEQFRTFQVTVDAARLAARAPGDDRIPIALSSEEPYLRWYGYEILGHTTDEIDFTYISAGGGLPFCFEHDPEQQIGFVEDVTLDADGVLRGMVRFGAHPDAPWIQADMANGIRKFISIGYWVNALKLIETEGDVDTYRVTRWTPLEGSTVAVPADPVGAGVGRSSGRAEHPVTLHVPDSQPPQSGARNRTMPEPTTTAGAATVPTAEEIRAAETERSSDILTLCAEHDVPLADAQKLIARGISANEAAREILATKRAAAPKPGVVVGPTREQERPFESFGDFLQAVARSARRMGTDPRLFARAAAGMQEGSPADGGFAIPPEFAQSIEKNIWTAGEIISRCRRRPMSTGQLKINQIKENSRADGSRYGGVLAYWAAEAGTVTAKKPQLRQIELNAQKLFGVWYATDELLEDAPALAAEANDAFSEELTFKVEDAIINGVGAGMPLGLLNSGAVVTVPIEAGQTIANSPASLAVNTAKMYARLPAPMHKDAVWLINQDVLPYIVVMTLGGSAASQPLFLPPGAIANTPYGSLWGHPILPVEQCASFGTPGDIIFTSLSQYILGERSGPKFAQSMHVEFLSDQMCFRATWRVDGQPRWNAPVTPFKGANTLSPIVTLATRA